MTVPTPDQILPENWVDEIEKAFWGLVAEWKANPRTSDQCAKEFERVLREFKRPPLALRCLSARQAKVILLQMRGLRSKAIACELNCAPKTVEAHAHAARKRLGLRTTADVILYGAKHQLVSYAEL